MNTSHPLLRNAERIVLFAGLAAAIVLGVNSATSPAPAFAQASSAPGMRIATVDVLTLTEKLVGSDKYKSARDTNVTTLNKSLEPVLADAKDLYAKIQALAPDAKDADTLKSQLNEKQQTLQRMDQEARTQVDRFNTTQVADAYRVVLDAAETAASQAGYTHVFASRQAATIRSDNVAGAVQEILARPVIRMPQADDLTDRVMKQLGLDAAPATPATPAAPGTPASSTPEPTAPK